MFLAGPTALPSAMEVKSRWICWYASKHLFFLFFTSLRGEDVGHFHLWALVLGKHNMLEDHCCFPSIYMIYICVCVCFSVIQGSNLWLHTVFFITEEAFLDERWTRGVFMSIPGHHLCGIKGQIDLLWHPEKFVSVSRFYGILIHNAAGSSPLQTDSLVLHQWILAQRHLQPLPVHLCDCCFELARKHHVSQKLSAFKKCEKSMKAHSGRSSTTDFCFLDYK